MKVSIHVITSIFTEILGSTSYIDNCLICPPDSHLHRVTNTRCRTGTVFSPDDGHIVARNM